MPSWNAIVERSVRDGLREAGFAFRGMEFQLEGKGDIVLGQPTANPDAPLQPKFHLVVAVPCNAAGVDHWPCSPATCPSHERPVDAWFDPPVEGDTKTTASIVAACLQELSAYGKVNLAANAARWDALHATASDSPFQG